MTNSLIIFLTFTLISVIIVLRNQNTHTTIGNLKMTKEGKAVNYTAENVERMSDVYGAAETEAERKEAVTSLAKELGKTINSIVAKLSSEGVYIKAAKTKAGAKAETKADIVADIAKNLGVSEATFESLSNATKAALVALREGVADA